MESFCCVYEGERKRGQDIRMARIKICFPIVLKLTYGKSVGSRDGSSVGTSVLL